MIQNAVLVLCNNLNGSKYTMFLLFFLQSLRWQLPIQEWREQGERSLGLVGRNHMSSSSDCCKYQTFVLNNIASNLPSHKETTSESYMAINCYTISFSLFIPHHHQNTMPAVMNLSSAPGCLVNTALKLLGKWHQYHHWKVK